jgi:uncharacterized membrane protein
MTTGTLVSLAAHVLVGAVWVGAVSFTTLAVLPAARAGELNAAPLGRLAGHLRILTRFTAVVMVLTGGHLLAARGYLDGALLSTGDGHLVVTMAVLWFVATGLTEAGAGRLVDGADADKVREPAHEATRLLQAAAVTGGLVLVDAAAIIVS